MPKDFFEENRTKIEKISKKLKNKKVIIYGTGKLFQFLKSENVFSDWDVVGVCDNKYLPEDENLECEGYRIITTTILIIIKLITFSYLFKNTGRF